MKDPRDRCQARSAPLDPLEEAAWRAVARAVLVVPKTLDDDLRTGWGLTLPEYIVLVNLSEAPDRTLRMFELSADSVLTSGGVTRLIARMEDQGLIRRQHAPGDGRGMIATLTPAGLSRLREAYPYAFAGVRTHIMDHLAEIGLAAFTAAVANFGVSRELAPRGKRAR